MYYKDDNEKPFDNNGFTFTDFLMSYGFDQLSWDTLPEEEKEQYRSEYEEMVSGANETIDSEGGLYEAVKLNRARKRFQQINEYILNMNGENNEADEQQPQTDDMQQPQQSDAPQQDMNQQGQMPTQQEQPVNNQQMPQDGGMEQGGDMGQMGDTQPDPTIGADADNQPMPDENGMMEPEMDGEMESDEIIDVDDLTQSQETTEYKLDGVDDKLNQLINIVGKFAQAIDDNEEKMEELKRELEERNPSQQERLNIRSMSGSPYTVSPQDYWSSQNARNPQYNVIADNDVAPNEEEELYTITDDDINNFSKSEIEKSINNIPKNLKDYFNESYTYGDEEEYMKWDEDLIYELSDYIEAQEVTGDKMADTNFGDIEYHIGDNGDTLYVTLQSEEDANDFVDVLDGSVGVYSFYRYADQPNVVRMKIEQ